MWWFDKARALISQSRLFAQDIHVSCIKDVYAIASVEDAHAIASIEDAYSDKSHQRCLHNKYVFYVSDKKHHLILDKE